jgi:signal transduction histidine kinase
MGTKFFTFLFVAATASVLIVVYYLFRKKETPGAIYFAWLGITCILWFNGFIIQINAASLSAKYMAVQLQYLFSVPFAPVFAYFAARHFSSAKKHPKLKEIIIVSVIPVITILLMQTNSYHHLFYKSIGLKEYENVLFFIKERGPWNYVHLAYCYLLIGAAVIIFLIENIRAVGILRKQSLLLLFLTIIPFALNIIFIKELLTGFYYDPTPVLYSICLIVAGINIYRHGQASLLTEAKNLVINSMPNGILVLDSNNRIVELNPAAKKIFNSRQDNLGRNINHVFKNSGINIKIPDWNNGSTREIQIKDNYYEASIIDIPSGDEKRGGKIIAFYDITERKNNEKKLREFNSAKDKLFSVIAHDLKNPVYGMMGISELLYEDFEQLDNNQKSGFIKDINDLSLNTHKMLDSLLDWSAQQSGLIHYYPVQFNICSVLRRNVLSAEKQAGLKNIQVTSDIAEEILVFADEKMIDTVARNLISNAIKFTGSGGKIDVAAEIKNYMVIVSVTDSGVGMSEENCRKLFKIDSNYKSAGTAGEKGTGLGLLLCKEFVEKNNGEISVTSKQDEGSIFKFTVPVIRDSRLLRGKKVLSSS